MNTTITIIIIIIIAILVIKYIANYNQEDFTNDEAIQNVASLYNQAKLSVTDFTSTGVSTLNTVNATTLNVANGSNINGQTTLNALKVGYNVVAGTDISAGNNLNVTNATTLNTLTVNNKAQLNGDLQVNGKIVVNGGIKMGPWNIVGNTNALYIFNDTKTGGIILKPQGGMTVQAIPDTFPNPIYGYMDPLNGVCQTCWAPNL